jgi:Uma2 family endonuclease
VSRLLKEVLTKDPSEHFRLYRVSTDEFERMLAMGVFDRGGRVELMHGVLVRMAAIGAGHAFVVRQLDRLLQQRVGDQAVVCVRDFLRCGGKSEPAPDLVVVRPPAERYIERPPAADDAWLVVEVMGSSQWYHLSAKVPMYASVGVPEVWVVDLPHRQVHVFADPKEDGYATMVTRSPEDVLVPAAFPDVDIPVAELRLDQLG